VDPLKKASEYTQHAHECRVLARNAQNEEQRIQVLKMAETWDSLAVERTRLVRDHPELVKQTEGTPSVLARYPV
jgi:hypothetical protein